MLIEIQGEHTGSITMFGNIATRLLKMMGQSGQPEGAILEADVPGALANLKAALAKVQEPESVDDDDGDAPVSLSTRAIPLIDLIESSIDKGGYIMWKPV